MLKNKGKEYKVRFNGIDKVIAEGALLDVRDFDISTGQTLPLKDVVKSVERQVMRKHPGVFEVVAHTDNPRIEAEYKDEITALKNSNKALKDELDHIRSVQKEQEHQKSALIEEAGGFAERERGYKAQIQKLNADIKELGEEHDAHVARIMGGRVGRK